MKMPSADVNETYNTKLSQLKKRRAAVGISSGRSNGSSYSADSLNLNEPPDSAASSSTVTTLRSEMGDDMGLSLAPRQVSTEDESSVLQMAAVEEQLRSIADENGRLMKLLAEKDYEIKKLKKKSTAAVTPGGYGDADSRSELNNHGSGGGGSVSGDVAAAKIIELSKKIREMTAELHKEQNKSKQYAKQVSEKDDEIRVLHSELSSVSTLKMAATVGSGKKRAVAGGGGGIGGKQGKNNQLTEDEISQMRDKLESTTAKMLEYRAQMETCKLELKKTQKALQSEVGEQYSVHDIISGKGAANWRGRQQKIIELQQKLQEYKEFAANSGLVSLSNTSGSIASQHLSNLTSRTTDTLEDEMMMMLMGNTSSNVGLNNSNSNVNTKDERNKAHIKAIEKKRQEEMDDLKTQVKNLESANTRLQQNSESSKARNKTLSTEAKSLKNQVALLKEKSQHDDELVAALMGQIDILKEDLKRAIDAEKEASGFAPSTKMTAAQEQVEKAIVDQLKQLVTEKESRIQELEMRLLTINASGSQTQSFASNFDNDSLNSRNASARSEVSNIPVQISKVASLASIGNPMRPGSSNQRRPESASNVVEVELRLQEVSTLLSAASVEKEKLREFCALLQKRVDESIDYKVKLEKELSHHKKRSVMLEKQLGAASVSTNTSVNVSTQGLPPTGVASKSRTFVGTSSNLTSSSVSLRDSQIIGTGAVSSNEELSSKCELLQEEIVSLKFNLQSIMKARDEDFMLYKNMIEETKNVFLTALRQIKQQNHLQSNDDPAIVNIS